MTSLKTSTKLSSEKDLGGCCDSIRTDSGFLSGANLISEENLSCENLSLHKISISTARDGKDSSVQIDSGVDIGLNEQFSGLTLDRKADLTEGYQVHLVCDPNVQTSDVSTGKKGTENQSAGKSSRKDQQFGIVGQPWELYFQQDEEGDTQLHIAIIQGFIEVVYSLIKMAPHPCFLDILNDVVQAPLHLAVLTHQAKIVRRLVVSGASVEIRDRHGNTPLHLACQLGDIECVKSLTEPVSVSEISTANLSFSGRVQKLPQDFDERNYEGETCLHLAAYGGHMEILKHLIWFGANVNVKEHKSGRTVLHYAVETLNHKLLNFLLDECPYGPNGLVLDAEDYAGHTAYQLARILNTEIAKDLVSKGADINVEDLEDDEHPDHNGFDDDDMAMDCVQFETENFQRNKEALSV